MTGLPIDVAFRRPSRSAAAAVFEDLTIGECRGGYGRYAGEAANSRLRRAPPLVRSYLLFTKTADERALLLS